MSKNPTLSEIKKRIDQAKRQDPTVGQLDLSEIIIPNFTPEICQLLEKQKNLQVLYVTGCGLKTLEGFPKCKFAALDLSKNELNDDSKLDVLLTYPELTQILFNQNKVEKLETVLQLKSLPKLVEIDFEGNPVSQAANYRETIFEQFPLIEIVDRKDKEGNEVQEEAEGDNQDDEDDEEEDYDDEDEDDEFDEDEYEDEEESQPKKKKGGNSKKK